MNRPLANPASMLLGRWVVLLLLLLAAQTPLAARDNPQSARHHYDIPALPLDIALSRFSEISGIDVLLREAGQRRSPMIRGDYTAAEALAALLRGSGFVARFTSSRSAVIVPVARAGESWSAPADRAGRGRALITLDMMHVTAPRLIGTPRANGGEEFAQRLVVAIRKRVMEQSVFEGGKPTDLRIATRITPDGALHEVRIIRGSRDRTVDARIAALLEGADFGLIPPRELRQPLVFEVSGR